MTYARVLLTTQFIRKTPTKFSLTVNGSASASKSLLVLPEPNTTEDDLVRGLPDQDKIRLYVRGIQRDASLDVYLTILILNTSLITKPVKHELNVKSGYGLFNLKTNVSKTASDGITGEAEIVCENVKHTHSFTANP